MGRATSAAVVVRGDLWIGFGRGAVNVSDIAAETGCSPTRAERLAEDEVYDRSGRCLAKRRFHLLKNAAFNRSATLPAVSSLLGGAFGRKARKAKNFCLYELRPRGSYFAPLSEAAACACMSSIFV